MNDQEAQSQVETMRAFILNEAKQKAKDTDNKAMEDFEAEKMKIVEQSKAKIQQEFVRKSKQVETQRAIARSTAINNSRLQKIAARQEMIGKLTEDVKTRLAGVTKKEDQYKKLLTDLIVQGLLLMIEEEVMVRVREADKKVASTCLEAAAAKYTQIIKQKTNMNKKVKLAIDNTDTLKSSMGGVVLVAMNGALKLDNTLDARLQLQMDNDKPAIRNILFPLK